ncbi:hypothetical protein [Amedibacillus sp. YH-ame10]
MNDNLKIIELALKKSKFWLIIMCFESVDILFLDQKLSFSSLSFYLTLLIFVFGISDIIENYKKIKKEIKNKNIKTISM